MRYIHIMPTFFFFQKIKNYNECIHKIFSGAFLKLKFCTLIILIDLGYTKR